MNIDHGTEALGVMLLDSFDTPIAAGAGTETATLDLSTGKMSLIMLEAAGVNSATCVFTLQDSDDGVTFTPVSGVDTMPLALADEGVVKTWLIDHRKVRRYVNFLCVKTGTGFRATIIALTTGGTGEAAMDRIVA